MGNWWDTVAGMVSGAAGATVDTSGGGGSGGGGSNPWEEKPTPILRTVDGITYISADGGYTWEESGFPRDQPSGGGAAPRDTYSTGYDAQGNYIQTNNTTGQISILRSAQPTQGMDIRTLTEPDGTLVVYDANTGTRLNEIPDPGQWQTVNLGNGQVVQVNSRTGETRPINEGSTIPSIASASSAGVWTQDPVTGELKWTATPGTGKSTLGPASSGGSYSASGRPSTAKPVDPYKGTAMQIAAQKALQESQQGFTAGQNTVDRQLSLYRDAMGQRFSAGEGQADRGLSNAQFGANYGLNAGQLDLQRRQFGLEGANTYANLVSTPDLAALPAFLQAGGGNVINGNAGGADMLTTNANTPAALALQQMRTPFAEIPAYTYQPEANPYLPPPMAQPALTPAAPAAAPRSGGGRDRERRPRERGPVKMAGGGMINDSMFMVGDRPDGRMMGTEEMVLNPTGAPLTVVPNDMLPMPGVRRFYGGTIGGLAGGGGGKAIADGTPLSPGSNLVTFTDGTAGWVTIGANGSIVDESGAPVSMGGNTVTPKGGVVDPTDPSSLPPPAGPAPRALPRGFVAVNASDIPSYLLPPSGDWTFAHNPTTGQVVRIDPVSGQQFSMYNTIDNTRTTIGKNYQRVTPPTAKTYLAQKYTGRQTTAGPQMVNRPALATPPPAPGVPPRPDWRTTGPISRATGLPVEGWTPRPAGPPGAPPLPPGVDTPAGTVNPNTGTVSQSAPPPPGQQLPPLQGGLPGTVGALPGVAGSTGALPGPLDNSLAANLQTVDDFRRSFIPAVPWNPMKANYWEDDPNLRAISELGQQTRYGTPQSTLQHQAARMRLPGVSRGNLQLAV